jgi:K(+)-stimulated pyrophosphate-energized sodium pump
MALGIILGVSVLGLVVAAMLAKWVLALDQGPEAMQKVARAIKSGAEAFLTRMNGTIVKIAVPLAALIYILYAFVRTETEHDPATKGTLALWTAGAFVLGAACSLFAGYVGMWISIRTNIRTATAARTSLNAALQTALRGGAVSGLLVVGMSLLGVGGLYALADAMKATGTGTDAAMKIPLLIVGYGFGASLVALFAQVGGGIYTKAADVGADLVGKVEAGIPEDDPRNPAVIADLVGDNVGDCAGRGADLFESTAAENIGAMILASSLAAHNHIGGAAAIGLMMFPLVARAFGIVASIVGLGFTKIREDQDPMDGLNRGYYVTSFLAAVGFFVATKWLFVPFLDEVAKTHPGVDPAGWWKILVCGLVGILTAQAFVYITQYFTEYKYRPVKEIADASVTGPATNIISGIAVGLESTLLPVITVSIALVASYMLGASACPHGGLFGTAVATMGMLGTAGYILAMDTFGPITDNAGGIVEMSEQPEEVRKRTDRLDSCGNTTKALTKGYAVGSAALAAFLLFSAYIDEVHHYAGEGTMTSINLSKPEVFVGALLGATLVFYFSALTIRAVGRAAKSVIEAVREQFKPFRVNGVLTLPEKFEPDYKKVVDIVTAGALKQMVLPGIIVVAAPIATGLVFKWVGQRLVPGADGKLVQFDATLGAEVVAGFLMVGTIAGILMALFLNNAGGAWDNAKKYIETGAHGGKRSDPHKAAVVGDTVGDPFKDTAGPSLHVLIKLLSTITLVLAPLFL